MDLDILVAGSPEPGSCRLVEQVEACVVSEQLEAVDFARSLVGTAELAHSLDRSHSISLEFVSLSVGSDQRPWATDLDIFLLRGSRCC